MTKEERIRQVQRQKSILFSCCIAFVIILIVIVLTNINHGSMKVNAAMDGHYVYESILVESGDSLWSIASEHQDAYLGDLDEYIEEIMQINGLVVEDIDAGEYIVIPVYTRGY